MRAPVSRGGVHGMDEQPTLYLSISALISYCKRSPKRFWKPMTSLVSFCSKTSSSKRSHMRRPLLVILVL
jgi:hypothetical protein